MNNPKFLSHAAAVLNTPLATLIHQAFTGQLDHDPLIVLPKEYVPRGHQFLGQLGGPVPALISIMRALLPYKAKFDIELEDLARLKAHPEKGLEVMRRKDIISDRVNVIHPLLTIAAMVQFPAITRIKFRVLEGTVCIAEADSAAEPLWPKPEENPLQVAWDALQLALQGKYENEEALERFERGDYERCAGCDTVHETEDSERCFDAMSNEVTRSLLHFWAFVIGEQKKFEPPTGEEALEAWKLSKTGAQVQEAKRQAEVMGHFARLGNMLFYAAVQDAHPSIRPAAEGLLCLSVLKDGMVVQRRRSIGVDILGALAGMGGLEDLAEILGCQPRD